jgi:hypothetical protein
MYVFTKVVLYMFDQRKILSIGRDSVLNQGRICSLTEKVVFSTT